jgi:predicted transcriptional regulator
MILTQIIDTVEARVIAGNPNGVEVEKGFSSDLMSDVLTIDTDKILLITGTCNVQAIRTAEMADIQCVLMVRGKKSTPDMVRIANESKIVLMETPLSMFNVVGRLYVAGLKPVY